MMHGLMVYCLEKFCVVKLINKPDCLKSQLNHPTISLQLTGDPTYDSLKKTLEKGRDNSVLSAFGQKLWQTASSIGKYISGTSVPQNTEPPPQDIQFLQSIQSMATGPDDQSTIDEIKQVAAEILSRRVKDGASASVPKLKSSLKKHHDTELDEKITRSAQLKKDDAWNTLRADLVKELETVNSVPDMS
jgi:hypothetical protein